MISHLNQYLTDEMTHNYTIFSIFLLCLVRNIFFGIKVFSILTGLTYENIAKWQTKFSMFRTSLSILNSTCLSDVNLYYKAIQLKV